MEYLQAIRKRRSMVIIIILLICIMTTSLVIHYIVKFIANEATQRPTDKVSTTDLESVEDLYVRIGDFEGRLQNIEKEVRDIKSNVYILKNLAFYLNNSVKNLNIDITDLENKSRLLHTLLQESSTRLDYLEEEIIKIKVALGKLEKGVLETNATSTARSISYIVFCGNFSSTCDIILVKNGKTGAVEYSSTDVRSAVQYAVDRGGLIVVKDIDMPIVDIFGRNAIIIHITDDGDYVIYTSRGIILNNDVLSRLLLLVGTDVLSYTGDMGLVRGATRSSNGLIYIVKNGGVIYYGEKYRLLVEEPSYPNIDFGAYCWVNHPNVVYVNGYTFVGYVGGTSPYRAVVARIDPDGKVDRYILWEGVDDDHATPQLDLLPDGRIVATVSKHFGTIIRFAITSRPYDISSWTIKDIDLSGKLTRNTLTYPTPIVLSINGSIRIYIFFRDGTAGNSIWRFIYSNDMGNTWIGPITFIDSSPEAPAAYAFLTKVGNRVYVTVNAAFGGETIPKKNVYFFYIENEAMYKANGNKIKDFTQLPLHLSDLEKVFDSDAEGLYGSWSYDVYAFPDGRPIIAFTAFKDVYTHYYYVSYYNGSRWITKKVAERGDLHPIIMREGLYSGGIWISRDNPRYLYVSIKTENGWAIKKIDIEGNPIEVIAKPQYIGQMHIHPVNPGGGVIIWMCGWYARQSRYGTFICVNRQLSNIPPKLSYAEYKPFTVALWFKIPKDMMGGVRHIIVSPNTFTIRLNNMRIEYSVWGMNIIGPAIEREKMYHVILEYAYGHLTGYLNLSKVVVNEGGETHAWGLVGIDGYLGIGYRIDQSMNYFWGEVGYVFVVEGLVGKATKQAFFNALFYGLAIPKPRISKGIATLQAGQVRITINHGLQVKPSRIFVQPYANTYAWVENITSTAFDIVIPAPLNRDIQISWYAET